jgi:hypothetical protein
MSSLSGSPHITTRTTPTNTAEHHCTPPRAEERAPPTSTAYNSPRHPPGASSCCPEETTVPTFETLPRFTADLQHLTPAQRRRFHRVVLEAFVPDLRTGRQFRPGLRIKGVRCAPGVYELTWAPDGRATWSYGRERVAGVQHVIWHRIGTHDILTGP